LPRNPDLAERLIEKSFPDVELCFAKNKNYEYGAWKYILNKYPDYDVYFCIQDSIILHTHINLDFLNDTNACTFHNYSGYLYLPDGKDAGLQNLKDSGFEVSHLNTIAGLVLNRLGISIVSESAIALIKRPGLVAIPFHDPKIIRPIYLVKKRNRSLSFAAKALWDQLLQNSDKLLKH
jgi:DNA-binding transcriptional LysR family regulator